MSIFNFSKKPVKKRNKRPQKTLRDILEGALLKEVKGNDELRTRMALKQAGYADLANPKNEKDGELKKQVDDVLAKHAVELIESDPDIRDAMITGKLFDMFGIKQPKVSRRAVNDGDGYIGADGDEVTATIQKYKAMKEEFGGGDGKGSGFIKDILNSEAGVELVKVLGSIMAASRNQPQIHTQRIIAVQQADGTYKEMSEQDFRRLQSPVQPKAIAPSQEQKPPDQPPELPLLLRDVDFTTVEPYLALTPEELVAKIIEESNTGEGVGVFLIGYLPSATFEVIAEKISPFKDHPKAGKYVATLLDRKDWIEKTITLLKEKLR
jgi:hypothetical protein